MSLRSLLPPHPLRHALRSLQLPPPELGTSPVVAGAPESGSVAHRRAAVALVVGPDDTVLLIRRAARDGDPWSGDMAFPGGRRQADDADDVATARRETLEEVGLDLSSATLAGALPAQRSPLRRPELALSVFPFLFRVEAWKDLGTSDEVASVHRFDVDALLGPENRGTFRYQGWGYDRDLPCVRVDGVLIWGMTLRMLDDLAEACGAPPRRDWPEAAT
jgi:8-oxo-dGTP pyrophosphatase MutT (NUDIX family)